MDKGEFKALVLRSIGLEPAPCMDVDICRYQRNQPGIKFFAIHVDVVALIISLQSLRFVVKEDVDRLHDLGWKDSDIMDALAHATNMVGSSILMKTFKMDQTC
jgi:hypothetical protein